MHLVIKSVVLPSMLTVLAIVGYLYSLSNFTNSTLAISAAIIMCLSIALMAMHRKERKRGWRLGGKGRDELRYEELVDGKWIGFDIYAELLLGRPSRVLEVWDEETWPNNAPEWARNRRDDIVSRIGKEAESRGWTMKQAVVKLKQ